MQIRVQNIFKFRNQLYFIQQNVIPVCVFHLRVDILKQRIRIAKFLTSSVFQIHLDDMVGGYSV